MNVAIVGGGAAGFFAAISVKHHHPDANVMIFEKSTKILSKVKISGGGRCNLTNGSRSIKNFSSAYPRGDKLMKKLLPIFNNQSIIQWFESRNVPVVIQDDLCAFPKSQNSQTIIDCFTSEAKKLDIKVIKNQGIKAINKKATTLELLFFDDDTEPKSFDKVVITTGGSPRKKGLEWLEKLGHEIVDPVPSLFTFNMPSESITSLMGVVVEKTLVNIQGTKLKSDGPLLITHWGMSGPAILKLSAFGARFLNDQQYSIKIQVNWINRINNEIVRNELTKIVYAHPNKLLINFKPFNLPSRLWIFLLLKIGFPKDKKWTELGKKGINKLIVILTNDVYSVEGKTTFKEEFVTCGGVSLKSVNGNTMESLICPNLYFAGEVLDIDGITGGFNFQAAWTTAFIAGKLL